MWHDVHLRQGRAVKRLRWKSIAATDTTAALTVAGDYVISHHWHHELLPKGEKHPGEGEQFGEDDFYLHLRVYDYMLSYRPAGQHVPLGKFARLKDAKRAAGVHNKEAST